MRWRWPLVFDSTLQLFRGELREVREDLRQIELAAKTLDQAAATRIKELNQELEASEAANRDLKNHFDALDQQRRTDQQEWAARLDKTEEKLRGAYSTIEAIGEAHRAELADIAREERTRFDARLDKLTDELQRWYDLAIEAWRDQVARLAQELTGSRGEVRALQQDLFSLKREGFFPPTTSAQQMAQPGLAPDIVEAIEAVSWSREMTAHLEQFAWGHVEAGRPAAEIAQRIREGDAEEGGPRRKTRILGGQVVDVAPGSPFSVQSTDDTPTEEDDDD